MQIRPRHLFIAGVLLLGLSAPPLMALRREEMIRAGVRARYSIEMIPSLEKELYGGALQSSIGGHQVQLVDDQPVQPRDPFSAANPSVPGLVRVLVDGHSYAKPLPAEIRVIQRDANRYWGFVHLQRLVDRDGPERLFVSERIAVGYTFRTLSVFADGHVVTDEFTYAERCSPPVRALMIQTVVTHPSGYCSDAFEVQPTYLYPLLYPMASGATGALLLIIAGLEAIRGRGRSDGDEVLS